MTAGSGALLNPAEATEFSRAGLALKVKSAASRPPAASSNDVIIAAAVSSKVRSEVSWGPRSESASKVRSSRRKLFFFNDTKRAPHSTCTSQGQSTTRKCGADARVVG